MLEYCILLVIARGEQVYASDILSTLKTSNMIVVEGTIYPLLSRLTRAEYLKYNWSNLRPARRASTTASPPAAARRSSR